MKTLNATLLILLITVTPLGVAAADLAEADERIAPDNITSILPKSHKQRPTELDPSAPVASALDLSLFGIISLGVLGLFWIRRHTSEL